MNAMIWLILFVVLVVFEIATMGLQLYGLRRVHLLLFLRHFFMLRGGSSSYSLLWFR